ncbi:MAG: hypothetical protein JW749_03995 [Sedimentisphaerales bacterium]|nr:hypothetical protein [Sedimentisphaerales bacterium]
MNEEKLKQILNKIGQTDVSPDVIRIAEQTSQSFTSALNLLQSRRPPLATFFIGFKRIAVAAVIFFAFGIGLSVGRWSKPTGSFNVTAYTPTISTYTSTSKNADGFWRQKALAAMQPRPYAQSAVGNKLLNAYNQYLKEKYND